MFFAISTLTRSNGLLHGTIFLIDAFLTLRTLLVTRKAIDLFHLLGIIIAGSLIALAFALPQAIAYTEFCTASNSRPWCTRTLPSIYFWVQKHYWNVGFLSYWTPGNIPLFLLAAPMLALLTTTALSVSLAPDRILASINTPPALQPFVAASDKRLFKHVALQLALPQFILAVMALTSFHVQIINRISSGCALWYLVLAIAVHGRSTDGCYEGTWGLLLGGRRVGVVVRCMAAYAIVQGGLYASFLPPA
jgi:phosphatidylinositol glycan class V